MAAGKSIVVAVDGSQEALNGVRWAATAAHRSGRPLTVLGAVPPPTPQFNLAGVDLEEAAREAAESFADNVTQIAAELAAEVAPELTIERKLVHGKPGLVLREASSHADLLVMGRRGLGGVQGLLMGSISTYVVAHADCPVVVVPDEEAAKASDGPVVVGVDGSSVSTAAIAEAFALASFLGAPLTAVHSYGDVAEEFSAAVGAGVLERLREEAEESLCSQLAGYREDYPDVAVTPIVTTESPTRELSRLSVQAQIVVVGSRGRGGFRGLVLGSTSQGVLHVAESPVMIVHGH